MTSSTPTNRGQMIIGADVNVRGVHDDAAAPDRIALDVAFGQLPDRLPIADIRPADVGGDDRGLAGALHDCVVDRFLRRLGEGLRVEDQEVQILFGLGDSSAAAAAISARNSAILPASHRREKKKLPEFQR